MGNLIPCVETHFDGQPLYVPRFVALPPGGREFPPSWRMLSIKHEAAVLGITSEKMRRLVVEDRIATWVMLFNRWRWFVDSADLDQGRSRLGA